MVFFDIGASNEAANSKTWRLNPSSDEKLEKKQKTIGKELSGRSFLTTEGWFLQSPQHQETL